MAPLTMALNQSVTLACLPLELTTIKLEGYDI